MIMGTLKDGRVEQLTNYRNRYYSAGSYHHAFLFEPVKPLGGLATPLDTARHMPTP